MTFDEASKLLQDTHGRETATEIVWAIREESNEFDNIEVAKYKDGQPFLYKSTLKDFPDCWTFDTLLEVKVANSLFLLLKQHERRHIKQQLGVLLMIVLKMTDTQSTWSYDALK